MKIRLGELRRLIREALEGEELALYIWRYPSHVKVVLYSPSELLGLDWENTFEIPKSVVKGYAAFRQTDNPCNDAWEVSSIAGIGFGKLLYGLGYALVPGGRLMPDRHFSSRRAKDAWTKSAGKMKGLPLDDVNSPKTKDPNDDCEVQVPTGKGGPDPVLDVAYEGPKVDPSPMVRVHEETIDKLTKIYNDLGDEMTREEVETLLDEMLRKISTKYFTSEFEKYFREK